MGSCARQLEKIISCLPQGGSTQVRKKRDVVRYVSFFVIMLMRKLLGLIFHSVALTVVKKAKVE
jgi:hypothetical protein